MRIGSALARARATGRKGQVEPSGPRWPAVRYRICPHSDQSTIERFLQRGLVNRFQKLAVASAVGILLPIVMGGVVRATGSGDACPDWPKCFGRWIPPADYHAILEYVHRVTAALSGLLLLALAIALVADRHLRRQRSLAVPATVAFVLLLLQSYLGKLVVETTLSPTLVTFHLAVALLLASTVTVAAVNSFYLPPVDRDANGFGSAEVEAVASEVASPPTALAATAVAAMFAVILVGAYMRAEGASLAFLDWPLMGGRLLPSLSTEPERIHFAHRLLVLVGLVPIVWFAARATSMRPRIRALVGFAHSAAGLYLVEVALGAANVLTRLSQWVRAAHVAVAAFALMASVASLSICINETSALRRATRSSKPIEDLQMA